MLSLKKIYFKAALAGLLKALLLKLASEFLHDQMQLVGREGKMFTFQIQFKNIISEMFYQPVIENKMIMCASRGGASRGPAPL